MKKTLLLIAIIIAIPVLISQKPPGNGNKPYVDGQIIVKLRSDISRARQDQVFREFLTNYSYLDLRLEEKLSGRLNIVLLSFSSDRLADEQVLKEIKAFPYVEMAQFNHFVEQREFIPSDLYFYLQWNMHNTGQTGGTDDADIDAPEAWEIAGSGVTATGDTIVIAIVDDGFDLDHGDLLFWKNYLEIPGNNIDDDTNGYVDDFAGWNTWANNGNIIENNHGTHVTGIACALGNNDLGVAGVNLHVKALPVVGSATIESIVVASYGYLYEMRALYNETGGEKGAFIVANNCSFGVNMGMPEDYPIWGAMYDSLGALGILSAGATANSNWDIDEVGDIPTAFTSEWLITVTNTDKNDQKNTYAAYGDTTIDLGAPGTQIYSTLINNEYGYKSGCSMSTPHVTGAIAYLFSVANHAFMEAYHNDPAGMALVIKQHILHGVDPVPSLQGITVTGGRLNIYHAAQQMLNAQLSVYISSNQAIICPGESAGLTAQVVGGTGIYSYSWSSDPAGFYSTEASITVSPNITTTYFLEVSDENGNIGTDSLAITVKPLPGKPVITSGPASVDHLISTFSNYTCAPAQNAFSYQWSVSPPEAGTSASTDTVGEFFWSDGYKGPVLVTVMGVNDCGSSEFSDAFTTEIYSSAGMIENTAGWQFSISPNPVREVVRLAFESRQAPDVSRQPWNLFAEFYNVAGILVKTVKWPKGQNEIDLNVEALNPGVYSALIKNEKNVIAIKKLIITR